MPSLRAKPICWLAISASVQWVAMRTEVTAQVEGAVQILDRADAGQQQGGEPRFLDDLADRLDPVPVGMGAEAVIEGGAVQPVAMGDLDGVDPGLVQRLGDAGDMLDAILVADGVHAVAQGDVLDVEPVGLGIEAIRRPSCSSLRWAIFSAVCRPAEVMMSRLPA